MPNIETVLFVLAVAVLLVLFFLVLIFLGILVLAMSIMVGAIRHISFECAITETSREVEREQAAKKRFLEYLKDVVDSLV